MSTTVSIPDELARRLAEVAAERGVAVEDLARELLEAQLLANPPNGLSFIGIGRSGRNDLSERHKEIRRELLAEGRARDV